MQFTFNQALMVCWHVPQVWQEAAMWMYANAHVQACHFFYRQALEALPAHEILVLAYARLHEGEGHAHIAVDILEQFVAATHSPIACIHLMRLVRRTSTATNARTVFARARRAGWCTWQIYAAAAELEYHSAGGLETNNMLSGAETYKVDCTLSPDGAVIASRILALALERFETNGALALHCVHFFAQHRSMKSARAVLERVLPLTPPGASVELWSAYLELEMAFGTAASVCAMTLHPFRGARDSVHMTFGAVLTLAELMKRFWSLSLPQLRLVEQRLAALHSRLHMDSLNRVVMLHSYMGLWPAADHSVAVLAEAPCIAGALGTEDDYGTAMCNTRKGGTRSLRDGGAMPDLADCREYTGQSVELENMGDVLRNRDLEGSLPVQIPSQMPLPIPVPNQMYGIVQSLLAMAMGASSQCSRATDIQRLSTAVLLNR
jgi:hypothetical protein